MHRQMFWLLPLFFLASAACSVSPDATFPPTATPDNMATGVAEARAIAATSMPSPTETVEPTATSTPSPTETPLPTVTPTQTPTGTPSPTAIPTRRPTLAVTATALYAGAGFLSPDHNGIYLKIGSDTWKIYYFTADPSIWMGTTKKIPYGCRCDVQISKEQIPISFPLFMGLNAEGKIAVMTVPNPSLNK
jgi:hypothetical protein